MASKRDFIVLMAFLCILLSCAGTVSAAELKVGEGQSYSTIQAAVTAASSGDTIIVTDGTYSESVSISTSDIIIRSENGSATTTVTYSGSVFTIDTLTNVTIDGFNITGSDTALGGGIYLSGSDNCTLINNTFTANVCGILAITCESNVVENNVFDSNTNYGIWLDQKSNYNEIRNNNATSCGTGLSIKGSLYNVFTNNTLYKNGAGISIRYDSDKTYAASYNTLTNNTAIENTNGIYLSDADNNYLIDNIAKNNTRDLYSVSSDNNEVTNLTLTNSSAQISTVLDSVDTIITSSETVATEFSGKTNLNGYITIDRTSNLDITFFYNDSEIDASNESTIKLYTLNDVTWGKVSGASLDTSTNNVSVTLSEFGTFGLFSGRYSGGNGIVEDPYLLSTDADIDELSETSGNWSMNFTLLNNITLVGEHTPIGNSGIKFTGNFDGAGYTISNLTITGTSDNVGFFGYTRSNANIHDLNIETSSAGVSSTGRYTGGLIGRSFYTSSDNVIVSNCSIVGNITGTGYVGGLIGYSGYSTITNSSSSGNVNASGNAIGGLIGEAGICIIDNCSSSSTIFSDASGYEAGGLIGWSDASTITNSHATGDVNTNCYYAGGLIAMNDDGTITNCYATGNVTGVLSVGGLIGENYETCTVTNCYATGNVINSGQYTGGLIGDFDGISTINNCSATGNVTGNSATGGLIGATDIGTPGSVIINNCYATGTINGAYGTGGLIGETSLITIVTNSYATGNVANDNNNCVGGLIGDNLGSVSNCFATGTVTTTSTGGLIGSLFGTSVATNNCYYSSSQGDYEGTYTSFANFTKLTFVSGNSGLNWNENITTGTDLSVTWKIIEGYTLPFFQWQDTPNPVPYVETISPSSGFNDADDSTVFWINITGCSFNESCTVQLTKTGQTSITGTNVSITYTTINATFDISSAITGDWSLYVTNPDSQNSTAKTFTVGSLPVLSAPALSNTTGNFYVNWTWDSIENADSYNVSLNDVWTNGTTSTEINDTGLASHATSEIQVLAYNATYSILSDAASDSITLANNPISISGLNNIAVNENELITVNAEYSDLDEGDTATFACNRTDLFTDFNTSTGEGSWQTGYTDSGTYSVNFSVSDGYDSTASQVVIITVTNVPTTMYVGSSYDYTTIQNAVDNATDGDIIIVTDGTYNENIVVDKSIVLRSQNGAESTIVNASDSSDHVFNVTADNVTIDSFNVTGATSYPAGGIYLGDSGNCTITNNIVNNNYYGIYLSSSGNNTLRSNNLIGNYHGIHLASSSDYNTLTDNDAMNNTYGIYFSSSGNNTLTSNTASYNGRYGMYFISSNNNTLTDNVASYNIYSPTGPATGIFIVYSDNNVLINNVANYNEGTNGVLMESNSNAVSPNVELGSVYSCGFSLYSSENTTLTGNTAIGNNGYDFYSSSSPNNTVDKLEMTTGSMQLSFVTDSSETVINSSDAVSYALSGKTNVNGYVDVGNRDNLNMTIFYDDSGMTSSTESSISLYMLNGSEWVAVPNASLDTSMNYVFANLNDLRIAVDDLSIRYYTRTFALFKDVPSSSGSGSSTRASVSQGQDPEIVSSSASSVIRVMGGSSVDYDFSGSDTPVLGVSFDSKNDEGLVVAKVQVLSSAPEGVPSPSVNSYQMMSIDVGSEGTISSDNADNIQIRFKVSRQWIEENNIDVSTIRMTRYHGEQWNDLPTYQESEDDDYFYFYAETPGFSIFEVVGDEIGATSVETPTSMAEEVEEPAEEETSGTPGFTALAGIVFVSLAVLVRRK